MNKSTKDRFAFFYVLISHLQFTTIFQINLIDLNTVLRTALLIDALFLRFGVVVRGLTTELSQGPHYSESQRITSIHVAFKRGSEKMLTSEYTREVAKLKRYLDKPPSMLHKIRIY